MSNVLDEPMTMSLEQFRGWMSKVNTHMLQLILLQGDANKPKWFTAELTAEIQIRKAREQLYES